ncbi:hypothetical protein ABMA28_003405 [Loxostege sticticalis]|uniref:Uncharacterized protein n=1 Tax=Loxostege sticticalis TaxID=481309 RepID=A0ABD0SW07_LOXSC
MESKLVFLLLLVCVSYTVGDDSDGDSSDSNSSDSNSSGSDGSSSSEDDNYFYPCSSDDLDCIRDYFANTNLCSKVSHEDGKSIHRDVLVAHLPKFNGTFVCLDDTITFYGSSIAAFYVDKKTNNLVMSISCEGINVYTAKAKLAIHVRGHEPVRAEDFINVTYTTEITAVMPNAGRHGVAAASVSSYNINAQPPFELGPEIADNSNEIVKEFVQAVLSDIPTAVAELHLTKAPYLFYVYLQEYICNFGIEYTGML